MISFQSIKAGFELKEPAFFKLWLKNVLQQEGFIKIGDIQYIFCDDAFLLEINKKYLNHKSLTDIITFSSSENPEVVSGEIYVSIDRIEQNKDLYQTTLENELSRVVVHGLLHLIGYNDNTIEEKVTMRQKEDYYLHLQPQKFS